MLEETLRGVNLTILPLLIPGVGNLIVVFDGFWTE